jgi:hypothetical protein
MLPITALFAVARWSPGPLLIKTLLTPGGDRRAEAQVGTSAAEVLRQSCYRRPLITGSVYDCRYVLMRTSPNMDHDVDRYQLTAVLSPEARVCNFRCTA